MAIDFDKVETVFEHNLTKDEIVGLFIFEDTTREDYIETVKRAYNTDEEMMMNFNTNLYMLYRDRGDKNKAMEFADRLPDCEQKWFSIMNHCL